MTPQHDHDEEDCPLCRGTGEVSISKDGTYEGTDYYGCPMCISRERDEEVRLIKFQRDELLAALREMTERIEDHPAYEALTEEEEDLTGGDTAELSYLARVGRAAIAKATGKTP